MKLGHPLYPYCRPFKNRLTKLKQLADRKTRKVDRLSALPNEIQQMIYRFAVNPPSHLSPNHSGDLDTAWALLHVSNLVHANVLEVAKNETNHMQKAGLKRLVWHSRSKKAAKAFEKSCSAGLRSLKCPVVWGLINDEVLAWLRKDDIYHDTHLKRFRTACRERSIVPVVLEFYGDD